MNRLTLALLTGLAAWTLSGCDKSTEATGTSDDTHSSILISGRVFTDQNKPLGAVIVKLRHTGLSDTTDGDGQYSLRGNRLRAAARTQESIDTIDYLRDGLVVHSLAVANWVTTMPDLFLVQRDISGTILPGTRPVATTIATLWNAQGDSTLLDLEWNAESDRYSGFAWFRFTGGLDSFRVQVKAADVSGRLLGISKKLAFTSRAGNIQIPSFEAGNLVPTIQILPISLGHRRDTVRLRLQTADPQGSGLEIQWSLGVGPWATGGLDTLLAISDRSPDSLVVRAKILRPDGLAITDSLLLKIASFLPKASATFAVATSQADNRITVHFADSDTLGATIVKRWIGSPWNVAVSGKDTSLTIPSVLGTLPLTYWVRNDRGDSVSSSTSIEVVAGAPRGFSVTTDSSFLYASWKQPAGFKASSWTISVLDSSGSPATFTRTFPSDTLSIRIVRTSPARHIAVTLSMGVVSKDSLSEGLYDTTVRVEAPNLAWNFESLPHDAYWNDSFGYPASSLVTPGVTAALNRQFDSAFQSTTGRLDYQFGSATPFPVAGIILPISDWRGVRSWSAHVRGTDSMLVEFRLHSQSFPAYEQLNQTGIALGWKINTSPQGVNAKMAVDSMAWPTWIAPENRPTIDSRSALEATSLLVITVTCTKNNGVCPGQSGFLVLDDIKFER